MKIRLGCFGFGLLFFCSFGYAQLMAEPPTNVRAVAGNAEITVSWDAAPGTVIGYTVCALRDQSVLSFATFCKSSNNNVAAALVNARSITLNRAAGVPVENGQNYKVAVRTTGVGLSEWTRAPGSVTPTAFVLGNGDLTALRVSPLGSDTSLSPAFSSASRAPGYVVQLSSRGGLVQIEAEPHFEDDYFGNGGTTTFQLHINTESNTRTFGEGTPAVSQDTGRRLFSIRENGAATLDRLIRFEADQNYILTVLHAPQIGAIAERSSYYFRIERDPDALPEVSVDRSTKNLFIEGTDDELTFDINSDIVAPSGGIDLSVTLTGGDDYVAEAERTQTATIAAGETTATVNFPITDDTDPDEIASATATVSANPAAFQLGANDFYTVTIQDTDNGLPTVTIAADADSVTEGTDASADFTLTAGEAIDAAEYADGLSVTVTLSGGDAYVAEAERMQTVTIAVGETTATVSFPLTNDEMDEDHATATASVDDSDLYNSGAPAEVELRDDEIVPPAVRITATAGSESVDESQMLSFDVIAERPVEAAISVPVVLCGATDYIDEPEPAACTDGSTGTSSGGRGGGDGGGATGTAVEDRRQVAMFAEGESIATVTFPIDFDTGTAEAVATATAMMVTGSTYTIDSDAAEAEAQIASAQRIPTFSIYTGTECDTDRTAPYVEGVDDSIDFTVCSDAPIPLRQPGEGVPLPYTVTVFVFDAGGAITFIDENGPGINSCGSTGCEFRVTIPEGMRSATATFPIIDDEDDEADVTLTAMISPTPSILTGRPIDELDASGSTTAMVQDDDPHALVIEPVSDGGFTEGDGAMISFLVTANKPAPAAGEGDGPIMVTVTLAGGDEFVAATDRTQPATFVAGATEVVVEFPITDDEIDEADATVTATISDWVAGTGTEFELTTATATTNVFDDDVPTLAIAATAGSETVTEPDTANGETAALSFTVTANMPVLTELTAEVTLSGAGDYVTTTTATATIPVGQTTSQPVTFAINGNDLVEDDVTVTATISDSEAYEFANDGDETATATVTSEDVPMLTIAATAGSETVTEPDTADGETAELSFTVTANMAPLTELTAEVTLSGADGYVTTTTATATIPAGQTTSQPVTFAINGNDVVEDDVTVTATISADTAATPRYTLGTPATATIIDNDEPRISITGPATVSEGDGAVSFTVTANPEPLTDSTVTVTLSSDGDIGSYIIGNLSQTVTIPATPATATVSFNIDDDDDDRADITVTATVASDDHPIAIATATTTITDNDLPLLTITPANSSVTEGDTISFTVTSTRAPTTEIRAMVTLSGGEDSYDIPNRTQPVTIAASTAATATATVTFPTTDNGDDNTDETITATISTGTGYRVGTPATVTISNASSESPVAEIMESLPQVTRAIMSATTDGIGERIGSANGDAQINLAGQSFVGGDREVAIAGWLAAADTGNNDLADSHFNLPYKASGGAAVGAESLTVWGNGNRITLAGDNGVGALDERLNWDGELTHINLGVDAKLRDDWLVGAALSWSSGDFDYELGSDQAAGEYQIDLAALHPYIGWSNDDYGVWASVGGGGGDIKLTNADGDESSHDATLSTQTVGGSAVLSRGKVLTRLKAEATSSTLSADDDAAADVDVDADTARVVVGVDLPATAGGIVPAFEIGIRNHDGDGETGSAYEARFGVKRVGGGRVNVAADMQVVSGGGYRQWSVRGRFEVAPNLDGRGLRLAVTPVYSGDDGGVTGDVLSELSNGLGLNGDGDEELKMLTQIGYGIGDVTPYTKAKPNRQNQPPRIRLNLATTTKQINLKLLGEQTEKANTA